MNDMTMSSAARRDPFGAGTDPTRALILGSLVVSVLCLAYIARHRLGVFDPQSVRIFWHLLIEQDYRAAMLTVLLLGVACLARTAGTTLLIVRALGRHPFLAAAVAFIALSGGAILVYHDYPLSMDEYSARFQAEVFAAGQLTGRLPPELLDWLIPAPFQKSFLVVSRPTGEVVSYFMPGFSLLLTPFVYLGVPWACNPAIGALSLLAIHRLARDIGGGEDAAGWAVLFALASPAFSVNAVSYYSMSANLLFSAVYALLLVKPSPARALWAGLIGGFALAMHSPPPHMLFAAPWVLWLAFGKQWRCLGALAAGYAPMVLILAAGWLWLIGDLRSAAAVAAATGGPATPGNHVLGWLASIGRIIAVPDMNTLNVRVGGLVKLWLWAVPGLPLLAWIGFRSRSTDVRCRLLLASAATTFFGYFLIPFEQGHGWGYRYFHSAWSILPVLAAAAMARASAHQEAQARFVAVVGALAFASLFASSALRAVQVESFIGRHLEQIELAAADRAQVAFVDIDKGYYTADMVQNHPGLRGKVLIMVSHGPEQNAAMARRLAPSARQASTGAWGELWLLE